MKLLNTLKLRHKLLLLISFPLIFVFIYTIVFSIERKHDLDDAQDVLHLARITDLLSIVHRLQFERSLAITYVANYDTNALIEWQNAAERSKFFFDSLPELQKQLSDDGAKPQVLKTLEDISIQLEQLNPMRKRLLHDTNFDQNTVKDIYTQAIEHIHRSISLLLKLAPGSNIFQLADALTAIAELKEIGGQERGLVSSILTIGHASEVETRLLLTLVTKKQIFGEKFLKLAPIQFQEAYLRLDRDNISVDDTRMVQQIIQSAAATPIKGDSNHWFAVATQRIDQLRELEKRINQELIDYADNSRLKTLNSLMLTLAIALVVIGTIITITLIATGRLVDGFVKLRDSAVEFTKSGELKDVAIYSEDELGDVAKAVNKLVEQLRYISRAVEAVANGDFEQHVEVKSERDRLALSLNHMIQTLRASVEQMQAENWLKTGQNELVEQIHSDQSVQDLAQKAINHLAQYLLAPVGAVYLVDQDETAVLCASYAYTFRKEVCNSFAKGESLVGQVVRERKPIIIDQLPPSYISISSGLGSAPPKNLAVFPLIYSNRVLGVFELGTLRPLNDTEMDLLKKVSNNISISLHAAISREKLEKLYEEIQHQSEELKFQQEELEQSNSVLEEQTKKLEDSQDELRLQKSQLTETNDRLSRNTEELSARNEEVEARSRELEKAGTALERKAEELAVASKYKSEFLANMSHELRTPLNSLLILSRALRDNEDGNLTEEQVEDAGMIYNGGMELLQLINDILDLCKVEAGKTTIAPENVAVADLSEKLQRQFLPIAEEKGVKLSLELDEQLPETLYTDAQKVQQVLKNLLSNAIKFTNEGHVILHVNISDDWLNFVVTDTGVGIEASKLESIFDAFQQEDGSIDRQYGGTGLGLTIARKLAHLLGGDIRVQSHKGKGSTFTLQLPLHPTVVPTQTSKQVDDTDEHQLAAMPIRLEPSKEPPSGVKTLLIIEDDPSFAKTLSKLGKQKGYQAIVTASGKEGLLAAHHETPAAIILDLQLPDIDGVKVLEQLKDSIRTQHIPVHIISARVDNQHLALQKGAIGYLNKPAQLEDIEQMFVQVNSLQQTPMQRVLVIEDDGDNQKAIQKLLQREQLEIDAVGDGTAGLVKIRAQRYDCVILDLQLPDMTGFDWLETIEADRNCSVPPVIVYTAHKLTREETRRLEAYTGSIIIKGAHSPERLLDEVTLFLHSVESSLSNEQRRIVQLQRDPNKILTNRKVLLVDDDMRNVFALSKQLKKHGMEVLVADNGELALQKLQSETCVDLVIMDIMMPVMDGYEAIRRIREMPDFEQLPVIALTARTMPDEQQKCFDAGANDYLSKPVDIDVLLTLMRVLLFKEETVCP